MGVGGNLPSGFLRAVLIGPVADASLSLTWPIPIGYRVVGALSGVGAALSPTQHSLLPAGMILGKSLLGAGTQLSLMGKAPAFTG